MFLRARAGEVQFQKAEYRPLFGKAEGALRYKFRLLGPCSFPASVTPGMTADGKRLQNEKPRWN